MINLFPCQNTLTLCLFSIHIASVQSSISQAKILMSQKMGRKFHKSKPLGQISVALVSIQSKIPIMRNGTSKSDLHHQVKMRSWENERQFEKIIQVLSNLRRGTNFGERFQEWVWNAELKRFLLTISNFIFYLTLWSRKSILQHESFCHIPDLKWIMLLTFMVCSNFAVSCKSLGF